MKLYFSSFDKKGEKTLTTEYMDRNKKKEEKKELLLAAIQKGENAEDFLWDALIECSCTVRKQATENKR